nr:hypothetical protein [Tanacetum cinerariifolium]
ALVAALAPGANPQRSPRPAARSRHGPDVRLLLLRPARRRSVEPVTDERVADRRLRRFAGVVRR